MQYTFTAEHIIFEATKDEFAVIRSAVKKRLVRAASGGYPLEYLAAWSLASLVECTMAEAHPVRVICGELPHYAEALATEAIDMNEADMRTAHNVIASLKVAGEGYVLLQSQPVLPNHLPDDF